MNIVTTGKKIFQSIYVKYFLISVVVSALSAMTVTLLAYPTIKHRELANQITLINREIFTEFPDATDPRYEQLEKLTSTSEIRYADRVLISTSILTTVIGIGITVWIYLQLMKHKVAKPVRSTLLIESSVTLTVIGISAIIQPLFGIEPLIPLQVLPVVGLVSFFLSMIPTYLVVVVIRWFYERKKRKYSQV